MNTWHITYMLQTPNTTHAHIKNVLWAYYIRQYYMVTFITFFFFCLRGGGRRTTIATTSWVCRKLKPPLPTLTRDPSPPPFPRRPSGLAGVRARYGTTASLPELGLDVGRQRGHVQQHVEHHRGHREHEAGHQVDLRVGHRRRVPLVHVRFAVRVPAHERVRRGYGAVLPGALRQPHVLPAAVERLGRQVRARVPGLRGVRDPRQPVRHAAVRSKRTVNDQSVKRLFVVIHNHHSYVNRWKTHNNWTVYILLYYYL